MTAPQPIDLAAKLGTIADHWNPRVVAAYNGNELRVVKVQGDFTWHANQDSDEMFLVLDGELGIEFRDGVRRLTAGQCIVVPCGMEHRPFAAGEAQLLLIDRAGEPNTGDAPSDRTRAVLEAI